MKIRDILSTLLFGSVALAAPMQAQDKGFVFTEDDVANADASAQQALAELIANGAKYETACRQAYLSVATAIGGCCNEITGSNDYVDCLNEPDAALLYQNAQSHILSRTPYSATAGQFTDGVLSRATLGKAKPNLTAEQYAAIEHMVTRAEQLMQWFMGPFSLACAAHHYEFRKEVQRVARFLEYTQTPEFKVADKDYAELVKFLESSVISDRIFTAMNSFDFNNAQAYVFCNYFHNRISDSERESWLCYMLMGSSARYLYRGPILNLRQEVNLGNGKAVRQLIDIRGKQASFAITESGSMLSAYTRLFTRWTQKRAMENKKWGEEARDYVYKAAEHPLYTQLSESAETIVVREDSYFKSLVTEHIPNALAEMISMGDFLAGFYKKLTAETNYVKNMEREDSTPLFKRVQKHIATADAALDQLKNKADRIVPQSDPSRQQD